jgi:hypothetical protein
MGKGRGRRRATVEGGCRIRRGGGAAPRWTEQRNNCRGEGGGGRAAGGGRYAGVGGAPAVVETREGRRWRQPERHVGGGATREVDGRRGARGSVLELRDSPAISENEKGLFAKPPLGAREGGPRDTYAVKRGERRKPVRSFISLISLCILVRMFSSRSCCRYTITMVTAAS